MFDDKNVQASIMLTMLAIRRKNVARAFISWNNLLGNGADMACPSARTRFVFSIFRCRFSWRSLLALTGTLGLFLVAALLLLELPPHVARGTTLVRELVRALRQHNCHFWSTSLRRNLITAYLLSP